MRLVVGEDSVLFREGLVRLLADAGHEVAAAVGDADAMESAVRDLRPDVVIADIRMPPAMESDGARAAARIRADRPDVGILLLSQHIELRECLDLVGTPGFGYLLKDRVLHLAEFDDALRRVADCGSAIDPEIVRSLVGARRSSALDSLSPREVEVLSLVAQGHSNASLATKLFLSERTVMAHMRSVFTKLGVVDDGTTHRRVLAVVTYLGSQRIGEPTRGWRAHREPEHRSPRLVPRRRAVRPRWQRDRGGTTTTTATPTPTILNYPSMPAILRVTWTSRPGLGVFRGY